VSDDISRFRIDIPAAELDDLRQRLGRARTDWWGVVLDAPDGVALAHFYSAVLGWPIVKQEAGGAAIAVPGTSSYLAFQSDPGYVPPEWPAAEGRQRMMMHIDVAVDDLVWRPPARRLQERSARVADPRGPPAGPAVRPSVLTGLARSPAPGGFCGRRRRC
jgi:hypothetical protein